MSSDTFFHVLHINKKVKVVSDSAMIVELPEHEDETK